MKNLQPIILISFFLLALGSCDHIFVHERGNGIIVSENRKVDKFTQIQFSGVYQVILKAGDRPNIEVETDENLQEYIEVDQHGKRVIVTTTDRIRSREGIKVYVTYTNLNSIEIGGVATIESDGPIVTDILELEISGAGSVDLEIEAQELDLRVSGASAIQLRGQVNELIIRMSGAGDIEAYDLVSKYCKITLSGIGSAEIYVEDELEAGISGVGGISYRGNPNKVRDNVSGLGRISDRSRNF